MARKIIPYFYFTYLKVQEKMSEEEQPLFDDIVEDDNEETVNANDVTNNRWSSEPNRSVTSVSDSVSLNPLMK